MLKINNRKAAPKIASSIDIHCEIQAVPFAQLSNCNQLKLQAEDGKMRKTDVADTFT